MPIHLSEEQKEAIIHDNRPVLVVAGAGSGKTRTLTAKIAYLVEKGFDPERILAITFTNKAADEMKSRLTGMTGIPFYRFPWVRTYHSACLQILKSHGSVIGYPPPILIYGNYQQEKTIKDILIGMNLDKKHLQGVRARISNAKNSGNPMEYIDRWDRYSPVPLLQVYNAYCTRLKETGAMDFDDLLLQTRNLLQAHKDVRDHYQELFHYVLVDEYQDTNDLQEELTRLFVKNGNLFCVGDDWQSIYGFRGSNVENFLKFPKHYKDGLVVRLEENFRSANEIVEFANHIIQMNTRKMDKTCYSRKEKGLVEIRDFMNETEEANWVGEKISVLYNQGIPHEKMAVLYRTKFVSLPFEKALRFRGISTKMLGGVGFFDRKEILDINAYLSASVFPKDDVSFERILNIPKRGIGPATVKKISGLRTPGMGLREAAGKAVKEKVLPQKVYSALHELLKILHDIRELSPQAAVEEVLERTGYMDYLKQYVEAGTMEFASRMENIEQLIYTASQAKTLDQYLEEAQLIREDRADGEEEKGRGVNLSTIHAAKGLEFFVVFVVACEETILPHWKSVEKKKDLEEERRLLYVAATRGEQYLFFTHAAFRRGNVALKSRFLEEIEEYLP